MKITRILFFILFFLSFFNKLNAQVGLNGAYTTIHAAIVYDPLEMPVSAITNPILRRIAILNDENLKHVRIGFTGELQFTDLKQEDSQISFILRLSKTKVEGDIFYRGFDLSDVLTPSLISATVLLMNKADSTFICEKQIENYNLAESDTSRISCKSFQLEKSADSVALLSFQLRYIQNDLDAFLEKISLINDYYACCAIMDSLAPMMDQMDFRKRELLSFYFIQLGEINRIVRIIEQKDFYTRLHLDRMDPWNLWRKYLELSKFSLSANMSFEENLAGKDPVFQARSEDSLAGLFVSGMVKYIRWSMYINGLNSRVYNEYLDTYFENREAYYEKELIRRSITRIYPGTKVDSLLTLFSLKIKEAYHRKADQLTEEAKYAEAMDLLHNLSFFVQNNPYLQKDTSDLRVFTKVASGICESYLSIAANSLQAGKMEMTGHYLGKARTYFRLNPFLQLPDSLYHQVLSNYINQRITDCDAMVVAEKYPEAIDCYEIFIQGIDSASLADVKIHITEKIRMAKRGLFAGLLKEIKTSIKESDPDSTLALYDHLTLPGNDTCFNLKMKASVDSLRPFMEMIRYRQLISGAEQNLNLRKYDPAYNDLKMARWIETREHLQPDPQMDSLWKIALQNHLANLLRSAEVKIWANNLSGARQFADSINSVAGNEGFAGNVMLNHALDRYYQKISERICWNATDSVEIFVIRAQRNMEMKNYIRGEILLDSALTVAGRSLTCTIDRQAVSALREKYHPAKEYQVKQNEADGMVSIGRFTEAILKFREADSWYEKYDIGQYGISRMSLYKYVESRARDLLTIAAIHYYSEEDQFTEAFRYLQLLMYQGYPSKKARDIMASVAKSLAKSEFIRDSAADPLGISKKYSGGMVWFANFDRAFVWQWNVMRNEELRLKNEE